MLSFQTHLQNNTLVSLRLETSTHFISFTPSYFLTLKPTVRVKSSSSVTTYRCYEWHDPVHLLCLPSVKRTFLTSNLHLHPNPHRRGKVTREGQTRLKQEPKNFRHSSPFTLRIKYLFLWLYVSLNRETERTRRRTRQHVCWPLYHYLVCLSKGQEYPRMFRSPFLSGACSLGVFIHACDVCFLPRPKTLSPISLTSSPSEETWSTGPFSRDFFTVQISTLNSPVLLVQSIVSSSLRSTFLS